MYRYTGLPLLLFALLISSCGDDEPRLDEEGEAVSELEKQIKVQSPTFNIMNILRASGLKVRVPSKASRSAMDTDGYVLDVNNGVTLEVYEYGSADDLITVRNQMSSDGTTVSGKALEWESPVHIYSTEKVIIAYLGNDGETRKSLASLFGEEFAGTR